MIIPPMPDHGYTWTEWVRKQQALQDEQEYLEWAERSSRAAKRRRTRRGRKKKEKLEIKTPDPAPAQIVTVADFVATWKVFFVKEARGSCFYCGRPTHKDGERNADLFPTREHIVPQSVLEKRRIKHATNNIVIACAQCNHTRLSHSLRDFRKPGQIFYCEEKLEHRLDTCTDYVKLSAECELWYGTKPSVHKLRLRCCCRGTCMCGFAA